MNRDFKGVWIPKEIWLNEELGWSEKILLAEIDSLATNGQCFASNEYFGDFLKISKDRASKIISGLVNKGYVEVQLIYKDGTKQVEKRIITTIGYRRKQLGGIGENAYRGIGENAEDINTISFINTIIKDNNNAFDFYQQNFGLLSPFVAQEIEHSINDIQNEELVIEAMKRALAQQKKWNYAKGIIASWINRGIISMDHVKALDTEFSNRKVGGNGKGRIREPIDHDLPF